MTISEILMTSYSIDIFVPHDSIQTMPKHYKPALAKQARHYWLKPRLSPDLYSGAITANSGILEFMLQSILDIIQQ